MEKLPPIEKIYEAYSALADGRIKAVPFFMPGACHVPVSRQGI